MSFSIAGQTFTPETAIQHAQQMLVTINSVRQSMGLPLLSASNANAIWLMLLAAGARNQEVDQAINSGFNSLNPSLCDDNQILNILPMVGTTRQEATYSTAVITVTVADTGQPITIAAGSVLPFGNLNFTTNELYTNATPPETIDLNVTCDTAGAVICPADSLTSFNPTVSNVDSVTNTDDAAIGTAEESLPNLRNRVIVGDVIQFGVNAAIRALRALTGITNANVFFNNSNIDDLELPGGITVPPRTSYIVITGSSDEIANAFYETMNSPTTGDETSIYTTLVGQEIAVLYNIATEQDLYVKVYYDDDAPTQPGFDTAIQQIIVDSQTRLLPGQEITSQFFSEALYGFTLATITGCEVSLDGMSYARFVQIDADKYASIINDRVDVIGE